eukprot:CAMPEP_0185799898 /NCGR_PEP_ID=MMETSP1322-20130828/578_1 /TAXON_ID=265543 /ORGANISM="Minutocellus polymorphus, Strain RCC2270" /LENGTH=532 /DNA_ID=CAMNT_0028495503 /DNA_START=38 /DNA_END=1633 /DNA_ORIENTATION=-
MSPNSIMATSAAAAALSPATAASTASSPKTGDAKPSNAQQILVTLAVNALELGIVIVGSYYLSGWLSKKIQSQQLSRPSNEEARKRLERMLLERAEGEAMEGEKDDEYDDVESRHLAVQRQLARALDLNEYETAIAEDVIDPKDIAVTFRDVGGIDPIKTELWDLVVLPLLRPDLFRSVSGLVTPPRGILLYGAPGTGKTMLAKAIARESRATFVNVRLSSIMDKWFGESNKLVSATFSLARKLAPSVIFIDEIDTFLSQRDSSEGSATSTMKSEFLTLWDGMTTDSRKEESRPVIVLGATNRPYDVDSAILRRLPRTFEIGLPDMKSRMQILNLFLEKQPMTEKARRSIPALANVTEGYSGSDLKELCRAAAMEPIRELTRAASQMAVMGLNAVEGSDNDNTDGAEGADQMDDPYYHTPQEASKGLSVEQRNKKTKIRALGSGKARKVYGPPRGTKVRPVDEKDLAAALKKVKRTGESARNFLRKESSLGIPASSSGGNGGGNTGIDMDELARGVQMLQTLMGAQQNSGGE